MMLLGSLAATGGGGAHGHRRRSSFERRIQKSAMRRFGGKTGRNLPHGNP